MYYKIKITEETVERLKEKVSHNRIEHERNRTLIASRLASTQDYDASTTKLRQEELELREQEAELLHIRKLVTPQQREMMEAKVRHAQANLQLAEEKLREAHLIAPFDGTVLKFFKREGEGTSTLLPEPVVVFGDLSRLRVRAEIDELFVRHLTVGQTALVFGRNLGEKTYEGRVIEIERVMGDKTVFTRASSERKDLNVLQVVVEMGSDFQFTTGLQVELKIDTNLPGK